uniref:Uncharacterized protein n=1 Tax=Panagrolaimus sp. JU765 TaxID=591449 RepID=A0AC34R3M0_9BILA
MMNLEPLGLPLTEWTITALFGFQSLIFLTLMVNCGAKKKQNDGKPPPPPPPAAKKDVPKPASKKETPNANAKKSNKEKPKDAKSNKEKAKSKKEEAPKGPKPGAVVQGLNRDNIVPQIKDPVMTERRDPNAGKDHLVSNPIVSQVTDQYPTVLEPVLKSDKTQSEVKTDKTQKQKTKQKAGTTTEKCQVTYDVRDEEFKGIENIASEEADGTTDRKQSSGSGDLAQNASIHETTEKKSMEPSDDKVQPEPLVSSVEEANSKKEIS